MGWPSLASRPVVLVVSGINYGENVSTCVTVSGTVGVLSWPRSAVCPGPAVSLETGVMRYYEHDTQVDFAAAIHFVRFLHSGC